MALDTVPDGPFLGWTLAEIDARLATLKTYMQNRAPGEGQMTSASVNGKSFEYGLGGGMSVAEEIAALQEAKAWVDDDALPISREHVFAVR